MPGEKDLKDNYLLHLIRENSETFLLFNLIYDILMRGGGGVKKIPRTLESRAALLPDNYKRSW